MRDTIRIAELIELYKAHKHSKFAKPESKRGLRWSTKESYRTRMDRIEREHGAQLVAKIDADKLTEWHIEWTNDGEKIAIGHGLVTMLRILARFGATFGKSRACREFRELLSGMSFPNGKRATETVSAAEAIAIRTTSRTMARSSVARAQSFQFEGIFRQKDVTGEWIPEDEAGEGPFDIVMIDRKGRRWVHVRGLRWEAIDAQLILRHVTSKRSKPVTKDLKLAPMVIEDLQAHYCDLGEPLIVRDERGEIVRINRHLLPASGPIIIDEKTGKPYRKHQFARLWRQAANALGLSKKKKNMNTRAGAITEAINSGAPLDSVRKAATHSDVKQTQDYSREEELADAEVARRRIAARQ